MKKKSILWAVLMMAVVVWAQSAVAQTRAENTVIENPQFGVSNTNTLTIDRVELMPDSTRLHMTAHHSPRSWVRIARETYIRVKGEKLTMTSTEGITPDKEFYSDETNQTHFVLNFPAVAADAQTLDFFENDNEDGFKFWDVALTSEAQQMEASTPAEIQEWANIPDDGQPLVTPTWKSGKAIVKGFVRGFKPEMGKEVVAYYDNAVTGIQDMFGTEIGPDGTFSLDIPIATTDAEVLIRMLNRTKSLSFLVSVGKETEIYIDRVAEVHRAIKNKALRIEQKQTDFFRGAHADINNWLLSGEVKRSDLFVPYKKLMADIVNMSLDEYKTYYMDFYQRQMKVLEEKECPLKVKEFLSLILKQNVGYYLFFGNHELESAFRQKHKLGSKDKLTGYNVPVFTEAYYSFLKELDMNNPKNLLESMYENNVNSCKFINNSLYDYKALLYSETAKEMLKSKDLNRKEKKLAKKLSKIEKADELMNFLKTDDSLVWQNMSEKFENQMKRTYISLVKRTVAKLMGTDEGLVFDLMTTQILCAPLEEKMLIPEHDIRTAEQLGNPFFAQYMREANDKLTAYQETLKQKSGYTIHQVGESKGEALLVDIVQQFKGKVIFIDLWATWCGPCRSAMTMFEPVKKKLQELNGDDLVFVYLTDQTSPEKSWKNMIPDIKGEHYRLSNAQLGSLKLMFNFNGVPSYLIVSKEGKVIYSHTGFEGNEKITGILTEELKK